MLVTVGACSDALGIFKPPIKITHTWPYIIFFHIENKYTFYLIVYNVHTDIFFTELVNKTEH